MEDKRFAKFSTDPKFRSVPRKEKKVKIDSRFKSMFTDQRFSSKVGVDKRGRPENFSSRETYEKFYRLGEASSSSDEGEAAEKAADERAKQQQEDVINVKLSDLSVDYARGQGVLMSESSSEDSGSEEEEKKESEGQVQFDKWGELDHDAVAAESITDRLAICNLDWDRVGAADVFLAISSFCPPKSGTVESVRIYVSEFGKSRLEEEDRLGPKELRSKMGEEDKDDVALPGEFASSEELERRATERIRMYQINRLKYYYAVATFSTAEVANAVYEACDGVEYELSATRFDLRFVPDDTEFEEADLKDECTSAPDKETYKPKLFRTVALTQGKVGLTWDETDPDRKAAMRKAYDNSDDEFASLKAYIALSSDDNDDGEGRSVLLGGLDELVGGGEDMEITWKDEKNAADSGMPENTEKVTPWEQYLHRRRQKKNERREKKRKIDEDAEHSDEGSDEGLKKKRKRTKEQRKNRHPLKNEDEAAPSSKELGLLLMDSDDDKNHFDYKDVVRNDTMSKRKRKKLRKQQHNVEENDDFQIDLNDARFGAVFESADFNLDPSHPNFKKTKSMQAIVEEKQRRIASGKRVVEVKEPAAKKPLSNLVSSVKSKSNFAYLARSGKKKSKKLP